MSFPDPLARLEITARNELESMLMEFDGAWLPNSLGQYSRRLESHPDREYRKLAYAELVKIDLQRCWAAGQGRLIEDYLGLIPSLGNRESVSAELIATEYVARRGADSELSLTSYQSRFPKQFQELEQLVAQLKESNAKTSSPTERIEKHMAASIDTSRVDQIHDTRDEKRRDTTDELPIEFGRYRILKELGSGAMGKVYLAHDNQLDRRVALKTPSFRGSEDDDMVTRFYREARAAAKLHHRNICPIYDVGEIDGRHFISMAYVKGRCMSDFIRPDKLPPQRTSAILIQRLAIALSEAHKHNVIHRDLKPANIMIDQKKEPIVMDFGLARQLDTESRVTQSGMAVGTPAYMSPEQVRGELEEVGAGTDIYALGVILYELLTGRLPFRGPIAKVVYSIVHEAPVAPSKIRGDIDPELEAICAKMMAKRASDRFRSMGDVSETLKHYVKGSQQSGRTQSAMSTTNPTDSNLKRLTETEALNAMFANQVTDHSSSSGVSTKRRLQSDVVSSNAHTTAGQSANSNTVIQSTRRFSTRGIWATTGLGILLTCVCIFLVYRAATEPRAGADEEVAQPSLRSETGSEDAERGVQGVASSTSNETAIRDVDGDVAQPSDRNEIESQDDEHRVPELASSKILANARPDFENEQLAAEWVLSMGGDGKAEVITKQQSTNPFEFYIESVRLSECQFQPSNLHQLRHLCCLRALDLRESNVDNRALPIIAQCKDLATLQLQSTQITTSMLEPLHELEKLSQLEISAEQVDDQFQFLRWLPNLRLLFIWGTTMPNLADVPQHSKLMRLKLVDMKETDGRIVAQMQRVNPNLRIHLSGGSQSQFVGLDPRADAATALVSAGIRLMGRAYGSHSVEQPWDRETNCFINVVRFPSNANLGAQTLDAFSRISGLSFDAFHAAATVNADAVAARLAGCPRVGYLSFDGSDLTDKGLAELEKIDFIRILNIRDCKLSEAAIERFKTVHPLAQIWDVRGRYDLLLGGYAGANSSQKREFVKLSDLQLQPESDATNTSLSWSSPKPFGPSFAAPMFHPTLNQAGDRLVFSSDLRDGEKRGVYESEFDVETQQWSPPQPIELSLTNSYSTSLSGDGLMLIHCRNPRGGTFDLYQTRRPTVTVPWGEVEKLENGVSQWGVHDFDPELSSDGLTLIFSSTRKGGHGYEDLWMSQRQSPNDSFSWPRNLGSKINTIGDESQPSISSDGLQLSFLREYGTNRQTMISKRVSVQSEWEEPRVLQIPGSAVLRDDFEFTEDGRAFIFSEQLGMGDTRRLMITRHTEDRGIVTGD